MLHYSNYRAEGGLHISRRYPYLLLYLVCRLHEVVVPTLTTVLTFLLAVSVSGQKNRLQSHCNEAFSLVVYGFGVLLNNQLASLFSTRNAEIRTPWQQMPKQDIPAYLRVVMFLGNHGGDRLSHCPVLLDEFFELLW